MKIWELLSDESKWTQGVTAKNDCGQLVAPDSVEACCWCLMGAVHKCYPYDFDEYIIDVMTEELSGTQEIISITSWNDAIGRTYDEVYDFVKRLDV